MMSLPQEDFLTNVRDRARSSSFGNRSRSNSLGKASGLLRSPNSTALRVPSFMSLTAAASSTAATGTSAPSHSQLSSHHPNNSHVNTSSNNSVGSIGSSSSTTSNQSSSNHLNFGGPSSNGFEFGETSKSRGNKLGLTISAKGPEMWPSNDSLNLNGQITPNSVPAVSWRDFMASTPHITLSPTDGRETSSTSGNEHNSNTNSGGIGKSYNNAQGTSGQSQRQRDVDSHAAAALMGLSTPKELPGGNQSGSSSKSFPSFSQNVDKPGRSQESDNDNTNNASSDTGNLSTYKGNNTNGANNGGGIYSRSQFGRGSGLRTRVTSIGNEESLSGDMGTPLFGSSNEDSLHFPSSGRRRLASSSSDFSLPSMTQLRTRTLSEVLSVSRLGRHTSFGSLLSPSMAPSSPIPPGPRGSNNSPSPIPTSPMHPGAHQDDEHNNQSISFLDSSNDKETGEQSTKSSKETDNNRQLKKKKKDHQSVKNGASKNKHLQDSSKKRDQPDSLNESPTNHKKRKQLKKKLKTQEDLSDASKNSDKRKIAKQEKIELSDSFINQDGDSDIEDYDFTKKLNDSSSELPKRSSRKAKPSYKKGEHSSNNSTSAKNSGDDDNEDSDAGHGFSRDNIEENEEEDDDEEEEDDEDSETRDGDESSTLNGRNQPRGSKRRIESDKDEDGNRSNRSAAVVVGESIRTRKRCNQCPACLQSVCGKCTNCHNRKKRKRSCSNRMPCFEQLKKFARAVFDEDKQKAVIDALNIDKKAGKVKVKRAFDSALNVIENRQEVLRQHRKALNIEEKAIETLRKACITHLNSNAFSKDPQ